MATNPTGFSLTAGSNNTIGGSDQTENSSPASSLNDGIRALAAGMKEMLNTTGGALVTAGGTTAYTVATPYSLSAYVDGLTIHAEINATNTGASTLNADSVGGQPIVKLVAGTETALAAGDLVSGNREIFVWDASLDSGGGAWVAMIASIKAVADSAGYLAATTLEGALAELRQSAIGTRDATTGGTAISFTSVIPAWAREITLNFAGLSTSGTDVIQVQLGVGGTYVTSGYSGSAAIYYNTNTLAVSSVQTTGFITRVNSASYVISGSFTLRHLGSNQWVCTHQLYDTYTPFVGNGAATVTLGGVCDSIRLTTTGGSDTFDANGGVNWLAR